MVKQKNELYTSVFAKGLASGVVRPVIREG